MVLSVFAVVTNPLMAPVVPPPLARVATVPDPFVKLTAPVPVAEPVGILVTSRVPLLIVVTPL
jgi:hypothetical protein